MQVELSQEEISNLLRLIGRAKIKGSESIPVAMLIQKLALLQAEHGEKPFMEVDLEKVDEA